MKRTTCLVLVLLVGAGAFVLGHSLAHRAGGGAAGPDNINVYFSPDGGCTQVIVAELGKAEKTVRIQMYEFTSKPIAEAVAEAKKRGVEVIAILDKSQRTDKYSQASFLYDMGVPLYIDARYAIAHNKIMLIDGRTIITGSFNYTFSAEERNAENLLVIHDKPDLYAAYDMNFQAHLAHCERYEGHGDGESSSQSERQR